MSHICDIGSKRVKFRYSNQFSNLQDMKTKLAIGPPVYFVVTDGLTLSNPEMQNILCNSQYCNDDSITNQIYAASRRPSKYAKLHINFSTK